MSETRLDNDPWADARPRLSILVPFKGDDPSRLLAALGRESGPAEVILLDDGSGKPEEATIGAFNGHMAILLTF